MDKLFSLEELGLIRASIYSNIRETNELIRVEESIDATTRISLLKERLDTLINLQDKVTGLINKELVK